MVEPAVLALQIPVLQPVERHQCRDSRLIPPGLIKRRDRVFVEKGARPTRQEGKPMELTDPVKRILDKIIKIYQGKD